MNVKVRFSQSIASHVNPISSPVAFASAKRSLDESEAAIRQELSGFHARTDEAAIRQTLRSSISAALATLRSAEATLEQKNTAARSIIETCTFDKATSTLSITYRVIF